MSREKTDLGQDKPCWTSEQASAIEADDRTLLVSAAAGSGKTAVLTERVISQIMQPDGPNISDLAIITFTRAAAAEMKTRIRDRLQKAIRQDSANRRLTAQLPLLESAQISTIDSFFYGIVREYFDRLDISAATRLGDDTLLELLKTRCMKETVDACYENPNCLSDDASDFEWLISAFIRDRDDNFEQQMLALYEKTMCLKEGYSFLSLRAKEMEDWSDKIRNGESYLSSPWHGAAIQEYHENLTSILDAAGNAIRCEEDEKIKIALKNNEDYFRTIDENLYRFDDLKRILAEKKPQLRGNGCEATEDFRSTARKNDVRKEVKDLLPPDSETAAVCLAQTAKQYRLTQAFLRLFEERYTKLKRERSLIDLPEVSRMVLRLLADEDGNRTDVALSFEKKYHQLYIDEYQDVNPLQDAVFSAISPKHRFMVGDIKQSIYGFRGSEPSLFASNREAFPKYEREEKQDRATIFLYDNFRSDYGVLDFCNAVFRPLFSQDSLISYHAEDELHCGSDRERTKPPIRPEICLLQGKTEQEAKWIADQIEKLIQDKVVDNASEIAVLSRKRAKLGVVEAELKRRNLSSVNHNAQTLFENPEVMLVCSLLHVIDNPARDVDLAAVLHSPLYGMSLDSLMTVRNSHRAGSLFDALRDYAEKSKDAACVRFLSDLERFRSYAVRDTASVLLRKLYRDAALMTLCSCGGDNEVIAKGRRANLMLLYEFARTFENSGFSSLYDLNRHLDGICESQNENKFDSATVSDKSQAVQLMTIHKSKGLQFRVVFLMGAMDSLTSRGAKTVPDFVPSLGMDINLPDRNGMLRYETPITKAIKAEVKRTEFEEEKRMLYVALTRAVSYLYVVGSSEKETDIDDISRAFKANTAYSGKRVSNYMEMVSKAIGSDAAANADLYRFRLMLTQDGANDGDLTREETAEQVSESVIEEPLTEEEQETVRGLLDSFSYHYPYEDVMNLPSKLAVSRLYPTILDEMAEDEGVTNNKTTSAHAPSFMAEQNTADTAACRGTATHTFMQFCDIEAVRREGAEKELKRLTAEQFLDGKTAALCDLEAIEACCNSPLFDSVLRIGKYRREQRFNISMRAELLAQNPEMKQRLLNETVFVQGVMDLVFEDDNGNLILVDYKTDSFPENTPRETVEKILRQRHQTQLSYYRLACEQIFRKPVASCLIYSFALRDVVKL